MDDRGREGADGVLEVSQAASPKRSRHAVGTEGPALGAPEGTVCEVMGTGKEEAAPSDL